MPHYDNFWHKERCIQEYPISCLFEIFVKLKTENQLIDSKRCLIKWIGLSSVLRPCQHSISYMGDSFYRSKTQPTVSKY